MRWWGCTDTSDADVINTINETVFVAGNNNDDNDNRIAKKRNYAETLIPGSVLRWMTLHRTKQMQC